MKCHILEKKVVFELHDGVEACDAILFHGLVDTRFEMYDNNEGDPHVNPLHLRKNVDDLAHILKPARNLIASEHLKSRLSGFSHVGFLKIVFTSLFRVRQSAFNDYDSFVEWITGLPQD